MPAKTTIAAAEKRVIKNEIKTHQIACRKVIKDCHREICRINQELRKLNLAHARAIRNTDREAATIERRIAILQGRL